MWKSLFSDHPASVGESYWEHMVAAGRFAALMALGALVCAIHAVIPGLFVRSGSAIIARLHERMVKNRRPVRAAHRGMSGFDYVI